MACLINRVPYQVTIDATKYPFVQVTKLRLFSSEGYLSHEPLDLTEELVPIEQETFYDY